MFPPVVHKSINISLNGFMNYAGIDYNSPGIETILFEVDEHTKKIFI